jgi:LemA protein
VLSYNNAIQTVPGVVVAGPFGFAKREFFEIEEAAREAPRVTF